MSSDKSEISSDISTRMELKKDIETELKRRNKKEIEMLKQEFLQLDFDGDGVVSIQELEKVLHSLSGKLNIPECEIQRTLQEIDKDRNGTVDLKNIIST